MKNIFVAFFIVISIFGCKKEKEHSYLHEKITKAFFFKPGSYWIYVDSISGRTDSCYISVSRNFLSSEEKKNVETEILIIGLTQQSLDTNFRDSSFCQFFFRNMDIIDVSFLKPNKYGQNYSFNVESNYPFQFQLKQFGTRSTMGITNFNEGGNIFYTVFLLKDISLNNPGINKSILYVNDSVGLVKKDIDIIEFVQNATSIDTIKIKEIWQLKRYKIIK